MLRMKNAKAISPLVATVLLVVFAIGISTLILTWTQTYTKSSISTAEAKSEVIFECSSANIDVESVYMAENETSNMTVIDVDVVNTGHSPVTLLQAFVWDKAGAFCSLNITEPLLNEGETTRVSNSNCSLFVNDTTCSTFDRVKVSTNCGGVFDMVTAPVQVAGSMYCKGSLMK